MGVFDEMESSLSSAVGGSIQGGLQSAVAQAASASSGGMAGLLQRLRDGGLEQHVEAWCAGSHLPVTPEQIQSALSDEHLQQMANAAGLPVNRMLSGLAAHLPALVATRPELAQPEART